MKKCFYATIAIPKYFYQDTLRVLKVKSVPTFCVSADGFYNIWLPFCGEDKKLSFCFLLTENPSSNLIRKLQ